jgi:hypothetical protein
MDSHRLTCEAVKLVNDLLKKKIAKIQQALRITFPKKKSKTSQRPKTECQLEPNLAK